MNRAINRMTLFVTEEDYLCFLDLLRRAVLATRVRVMAYCIMPNHWHIALQSVLAGDVTLFAQWLTAMHARNWRLRDATSGLGHVYQGRYKSILVQDGSHACDLFRYVERNALRAGLVTRAQDWPWSSLAQREFPPRPEAPRLSPWPVPMRDDWTAFVNDPRFDHELPRIRKCIDLGVPFGSFDWASQSWRPTRRVTLDDAMRLLSPLPASPSRPVPSPGGDTPSQSMPGTSPTVTTDQYRPRAPGPARSVR